MRHLCVSCGKPSTTRHQIKFCSNKCQAGFRYRQFLSNWKNRKTSGNIGIKCRNISTYLRRYLLEKYNARCSVCGWNKKNPVTGNVPLEVDHIDGNAENNSEKNLRLTSVPDTQLHRLKVS